MKTSNTCLKIHIQMRDWLNMNRSDASTEIPIPIGLTQLISLNRRISFRHFCSRRDVALLLVRSPAGFMINKRSSQAWHSRSLKSGLTIEERASLIAGAMSVAHCVYAMDMLNNPIHVRKTG